MEDEKTIYETFNNYFKGDRPKAVAVITDKQVVFRISNSDNYKEVGSFHGQIAKNITKDMGIELNDQYGRNKFRRILMCIEGKNIAIYVENDEKSVSYSQYCFMDEILKALENAQKNTQNKGQDNVILFSYKTVSDSIDRIREELKSRITRDNYKLLLNLSQEEKIIGITASKEKIKEQLMFNLNLQNIKNFRQLISKIWDLGYNYYNDDFYKEPFCEAIPDFEKLIPVFKNINITINTNRELDGVNPDNIKDIVIENSVIDNNQNNKKDENDDLDSR